MHLQIQLSRKSAIGCGKRFQTRARQSPRCNSNALCATFLSSGKRRADLQFNGNSRQEPIYIYADSLDLELVLLNLLRNAEEAQTTVLAPFIHLDVFSDGKEAYVRIVDNGPPTR